MERCLNLFIHALFARPQPIGVWNLFSVREIVIVFPEASHIFLKTGDGVRSVAKYSPCALEKVITAAKLDTVVKVEDLRSYCS